jgi:hypothetical protein
MNLCFLTTQALISFAIFTSVSFGQTDMRGVGKIKVHTLGASDLNILRQYLTGRSKNPLNDTIIIKYDYNIGTCWHILDGNSDEYVQGFVRTQQKRVITISQNRPEISVFRFREKGNKFNKLIKLDSSIMVDDERILRKLLFRKRSQCGNSVLILPNGKYLHLTGDSHFRILDLPSEILRKKLN